MSSTLFNGLLLSLFLTSSISKIKGTTRSAPDPLIISEENQEQLAFDLAMAQRLQAQATQPALSGLPIQAHRGIEPPLRTPSMNVRDAIYYIIGEIYLWTEWILILLLFVVIIFIIYQFVFK